MNKENLKIRIAEIAYNVIFGAKRHFSSYDIVEKLPTYFGIVTSIVGIASLAYPIWGHKLISFALTAIGACIVYLNFYTTQDKEDFKSIGKNLTDKYNSLRSLYEKVDSASPSDLATIESDLNTINSDLHKIAIHKQVFGSDIFAHYKLFGESQSKWIVDTLKLKIWKDMIPFSLKAFFASFLVMFIGLLACNLYSGSTLSNCIGDLIGN